VVDDANPRAVVSMIGPGKPLPASVNQSDALVDAADDAFVAGIRAALAVGAVVSLLALVAGYRVFPRGRKEERSEVTEARHLVREERPALDTG